MQVSGAGSRHVPLLRTGEAGADRFYAVGWLAEKPMAKEKINNLRISLLHYRRFVLTLVRHKPRYAQKGTEMEPTAESEPTVKSQVETPVEPTTVRVVVERETPLKKGTSSRGSRRLMEIDPRVAKGMRRVTRALDSGVDTYIEHRDKSKESRKDGVIVDFFENVSYGVSRAMSEASPLVHDVTETFNTRKLRSQIRRAARTFGSLPFVG